MALYFADLRQGVSLAGVALNNVSTTQSGGKVVLVGSRVDLLDVGPADVVQFTEKNALKDGMDLGAAYLGTRLITVRGTSFNKTRGETYDLVSAIEGAARIVSGGFGLVAFVFASLTGSSGSTSSVTFQVRPNGLSVPVSRDMFGGDNTDAIGIPWSFTAVAMNPSPS